MKKYIFFTTGAQQWVDLANRLHDEGVATPILWIGDPRHEKTATAKFGTQVVRSMDMLVHFPWRIEGLCYEGQGQGFFTSEQYYRAKDRALKMLDRLDVYGSLSRLDREVYFKNICIWGLLHITKSNPDLLLMTESPHSHVHYTLYEICNYLEIPAFKLSPWPIAPVLTVKSMESSEKIQTGLQLDDELHDQVQELITSYVDKISGLNSNERYETDYLRLQRSSSAVYGKFKRLFSYKNLRIWGSRLYHRCLFAKRNEYSPLAPSFSNILISGLVKRARLKSLLNNYNQLCIDLAEIDQPYVYFGLHYEPERTTNPDGAEFHDQVLALIKLRSILPENVSIVVKEHPSQFYSSMRGVQGRSPLFYEHISNINGVYLISSKEDSISLIRKSLFVSTITGSLANEAAILGKPALIFGDAWFLGMPNVIKWSDGLKYSDITSREIANCDDIKTWLLNEYQNYYAIGCHNTSGEQRFAAFLNERFRRVELNEFHQVFKNLFDLI